MSYWSTAEADIADMWGSGFAVRADDGEIIALCVEQAEASKIVNALNHACIPTRCKSFRSAEACPEEAAICFGHYYAARADERPLPLGR